MYFCHFAYFVCDFFSDCILIVSDRILVVFVVHIEPYIEPYIPSRPKSSRTSCASETLSVRPVVTIQFLLVNVIWYNFVFIVPQTNLTLVVTFVYYNTSLTPGNA